MSKYLGTPWARTDDTLAAHPQTIDNEVFMRERLRRWINDAAIHDPIEVRKAEFLTVMIIGLFVLGFVGTPISFLTPLSAIQKSLTVSADLTMSAFMAAALLVLRCGRLNNAVLLTICGLLVPLSMTLSALGIARGGYVLVAFLMPVVLAGVMADVVGLAFTITVSAGIVFFTFANPLVPQPELPLPAAAIISVFTLIAIVLGVFLHRFSRVLERTINEMLIRERELEHSRLVLERNMSALEREIVERRRAEFALRESDDKFRALVTHSPVGIFQATPLGDYLFVNKQWSDLAGLPPEAALGEGWQAALHPDDAAHVIESWQLSVTGGQRLRRNTAFCCPAIRCAGCSAPPSRCATGPILY